MTVTPIPEVEEKVFVPPPIIIEEVVEEVIEEEEEEEPEPVIPVFVPVWDIKEEPDENFDSIVLADELRQQVNEDQVSYPTPEASIS